MPDQPTTIEHLRIGDRGREGASAVSWPYKQSFEDDRRRRAHAARREALMQTLVGCLAAGCLMWLSHEILAAVALVIAAVNCLVAMCWPTTAWVRVKSGLTTIGRAAGVAIGWLALLPLFVLFFVPFGLLFRRGAKDPMKRHFDAQASTYWRQRQQPDEILRRLRQQS